MINFHDSFLDLLPRKLDDAQTRALKVQGNAVIAAGAGSGKTQVLATRFAWLIMTDQAKVDEILTLTFTNKAASEMYQRIYETLSFFANHEECPQLSSENRKLAKEALDSFANAHIQTLDSYCGSIVRQCANRYGIKPDFTTGSADSTRDIKNKAFNFVLENKDNYGIQTFADPGKLQDFAENTLGTIISSYTSLATEENYFINKLKLQKSEIVEAWNYYILGYVQDSPFALTTDKYSISQYISTIQSALLASPKYDAPDKQPYIATIEKLISKASDIFNLDKISENDVEEGPLESAKIKEQIEKIEDFFDFTLSTTKASGKIMDVSKIVTQLKNDNKDFFATIIAYVKQYKAILELNKLFDIFLKEVNSSKRTSGNLTFNDVTELALKMLVENEDIRNQEKTSFKKIMIDEFQDNNGKNRDLLYLLSLKDGEFENGEKCDISQIVVRDENGNIINDRRNPNKLFFVGDEKQSIYKFRGADVSVFNELTKDGENALIPMTYNYRSEPEVLSSFNYMFHGGNGIFSSEANGKKEYEAYYEREALKNGTDLPALTKENIPIHVNLLNSKIFAATADDFDFIPEKEQLAYFMAKKIYEIGHESKNWKNIAILDRSRTDRNIITKYLTMFNVPYEVDQFNNIFEDGIINDFYNFFRICVYPSDINSYGSYLTSPICGLSVNNVEIILSHLIDYANENEIPFTPFPQYENCEVYIKEDLDEVAYNKYISGKNYFYNMKSKVLQNQITTTISELWHKKGYKYESMLSQQTELAAEHFDMLFELGRQADLQGKSVSWFVDQLELLKKTFISSDADLDAAGITYPLERQSAVQIMTIHKSKGLQFDNVFVYGCFGVNSKADKSNIYFSEDFGVTLKPELGSKNYFYVKGNDLYKAKEVAEFRRLIYVAITRAIKSVNIVGAWNPESTSDSQLRLLEYATMKYYLEPDNDYLFNDEAGFDFYNIKPVEYSQIPDINNKSPIDSIRENVFDKTADIYENADIIEYKSSPIERKTPSSLEPAFVSNQQELISQEPSDKDSGLKYEESPDLLTTPEFTAADFGTLVHAYLEAQANGIQVQDFYPPIGLFKNLTESEIIEKKNICMENCRLFNKCSLGVELNKCKSRGDFFRAEWGFRMMYEEAIFTGSIDLIYSNGDGTYTIVDYKSDNTVEPEKYIGQQHCYRTAASKLLKVTEDKIILRLYYTKKDKIVELE